MAFPPNPHAGRHAARAGRLLVPRTLQVPALPSDGTATLLLIRPTILCYRRQWVMRMICMHAGSSSALHRLALDGRSLCGLKNEEGVAGEPRYC